MCVLVNLESGVCVCVCATTSDLLPLPAGETGLSSLCLCYMWVLYAAPCLWQSVWSATWASSVPVLPTSVPLGSTGSFAANGKAAAASFHRGRGRESGRRDLIWSSSRRQSCAWHHLTHRNIFRGSQNMRLANFSERRYLRLRLMHSTGILPAWKVICILFSKSKCKEYFKWSRAWKQAQYVIVLLWNKSVLP